MPFTAIYGLPGRGKSLLMIQYGLRIAEQYRMRVCSNFLLDPLNLAYYCKIQNYSWLFDNLDKGIIYYISSNKNFAQFLQIPNAIILLDEMGLYAPSAQSWTLPPEAYNAIANNRKNAQHIVYCAQNPAQVHSAVHAICSDVLYAEGTVVWDVAMRNYKLLFKDSHAFLPPEFEVWYRDPKIRKNPVKVWVLATKHWKGPLNASDEATFRLYDSFALLENQDSIKIDSEGFTYYPYIVDSATGTEFSAAELSSNFGYNFSEIEEKLDEFYKADRFKKKRIYEATGKHPFVAWKLEGKLPFPGPHRFSKFLLKLWNIFPANSYSKLKRLDLWVHYQLICYDKLSQFDRDSLGLFFKALLGFLVFVFVTVLWRLIF